MAVTGTVITSPPLISVITVTRNDSENLIETINSFRSQTYPNLEFIIVDGASVDDTIDVIKSNSDIINTWVSEPDDGIYHAMNKGLDLAKGFGVIFLNSGDCFDGNVLKEEIKIPCIFSCRIVNQDGDSRIRRFGKIYMGMPTSHQCIVFKNSDSRFNTNYRISSDYDYSLRTNVFSDAHYYSDSFILYDNSGLSNQKYWVRDLENLQIIYSYFGIFKASIFFVIMILKGLVKIFIRWF